eukprot:14064-Heterococcus_DN1.PRE.7
MFTKLCPFLPHSAASARYWYCSEHNCTAVTHRKTQLRVCQSNAASTALSSALPLLYARQAYEFMNTHSVTHATISARRFTRSEHQLIACQSTVQGACMLAIIDSSMLLLLLHEGTQGCVTTCRRELLVLTTASVLSTNCTRCRISNRA